MRDYSGVISLTKNGRGVYCLDTTMGCKSGMENEKNGCYNDCYAAKSARFYGYDFNKTILREFKDERHRREILNQINNIKLDFVRIGCSGDPSENWQHTIKILKGIDTCNKQIVIITRHWTILTDEQLDYFKTINVCVNTSISALDKTRVFNNCLEQYNRLKYYCKSILRIVSCDFNTNNETGLRLSKMQEGLFKNDSTLDTVLRVNKKNKFVTDEIINIKRSRFIGKNAFVSRHNKKTYLGKCGACKEMCGINIKPEIQLYPNKRGIFKQLNIFKQTP